MFALGFFFLFGIEYFTHSDGVEFPTVVRDSLYMRIQLFIVSLLLRAMTFI